MDSIRRRYKSSSIRSSGEKRRREFLSYKIGKVAGHPVQTAGRRRLPNGAGGLVITDPSADQPWGRIGEPVCISAFWYSIPRILLGKIENPAEVGQDFLYGQTSRCRVGETAAQILQERRAKTVRFFRQQAGDRSQQLRRIALAAIYEICHAAAGI